MLRQRSTSTLASSKRVRVTDDGHIHASIAIHYQPPYAPDLIPRPSGGELSTIRFFEPGVPAQLARLADPVSDRQITIEVTATILDNDQ